MHRRFCLALVILISGCVASPRGDAPPSWVDRRATLLELTSWSLSGRIGLRVEDRGFSGGLNWRQSGDRLRVDFRGPLGAGAFRVSGDPGALVLETGDGEFFLFDDPQTALRDELGWGIPLDAMRYWLLGLPHPGYPAAQQFDDSGRLSEIEQLDWRVAYERYVPAAGWEMPRKLVLTGGDIRIRLVISNWSLGPTE